MAFFRKSLGDFTTFVDNIWNKIERNFQYHQEEVQDWALHLEHCQSILMKFDAKDALSEDFLVWYFYESLRPSIKLWINQKGQEWDG